MNDLTQIVSLERVCKSCTVLKPFAEFHAYGPDRLSWKCRECHSASERARQKALWASDPEYRARHNAAGKLLRRGVRCERLPAAVRGNERPCKVCAVVKPMADFPMRGAGHRLHTCSPCYNDAEALKARARYREDDGYYASKSKSWRKASFKSRYGITPEQADAALLNQHGLCANRGCGLEISFDAPKASGKRAVVDHCHETGKFRAILCDGCNLFLGRIEKSKNRHIGLLEYADRYK
jgi:hypothetical protein